MQETFNERESQDLAIPSRKSLGPAQPHMTNILITLSSQFIVVFSSDIHL